MTTRDTVRNVLSQMDEFCLSDAKDRQAVEDVLVDALALSPEAKALLAAFRSGHGLPRHRLERLITLLTSDV